MIYGVNDIEIILLKLVFIAAVLIPVIPETEIFSITTFPILRILLFPSVLELIKFSTVENLYTTKEEKTKLTLAQINNVNLNSIIEPGFYVSVKWDNNISGLPTELNNNEGRAFYLVVFALDSTNSYCQQVLYSFKGLIFYRAITDTNSTFTQWKRINLI